MTGFLIQATLYLFAMVIAVPLATRAGLGSVLGIFIGTLTFAVVSQGIYFTQLDRNWSALIIGVMLLVAVLMNNAFRDMALSYPRRRERSGSVRCGGPIGPECAPPACLLRTVPRTRRWHHPMTGSGHHNRSRQFP